MQTILRLCLSKCLSLCLSLSEDTRLCLDVTHCLGHPIALSPLSTCQIYARNTGQLNPVIGRYTDSSIPALKMISADGWNEETTYHFRDGPRHCKTILNTLIFRMTSREWNVLSAVKLCSQPHLGTRYLNRKFCYVEQYCYRKINQQNAFGS